MADPNFFNSSQNNSQSPYPLQQNQSFGEQTQGSEITFDDPSYTPWNNQASVSQPLIKESTAQAATTSPASKAQDSVIEIETYQPQKIGENISQPTEKPNISVHKQDFQVGSSPVTDEQFNLPKFEEHFEPTETQAIHEPINDFNIQSPAETAAGATTSAIVEPSIPLSTIVSEPGKIPLSTPIPQPLASTQPTDMSQTVEGAAVNSAQNSSYQALANLRPKNKKCGLLAAVGALAIIFLLASSVFITEAGVNTGLDKIYNKIGLEKLWNGLPFDGKVAMAASANKMQSVKSAHYEGNVEITAKLDENSSDPAPFMTFLRNKASFAFVKPTNGIVLGTSTLNEADASEVGQTSYTIKSTINGDYGENKQQMRMTIESPILGSGLSAYGFGGLTGDSLAVDLKANSDKFYLRVPALSLMTGSENNKWLEFDKKDIESLDSSVTTDQKNPLQEAAKYNDLIKTSKKIGVEEIGQVKATKYETVIDTTKIGGFLGDPSISSELMQYNPDLKFYAWIGQKDHLTYKVEAVLNLSYQKSTGKVGFAMTFSDFNKDFNIEVPKPEEIESGGFGALMNAAMGEALTVAEPKARDTQRKSDLRSLKVALEVYYSDHNKYPVSRQYCNVADTKCLGSALTPEYIMTIPSDPTDGQSYKYKSDGNTFELTALLESADDSEGQVMNGQNIYSLQNE